jgi:hypothetical protein
MDDKKPVGSCRSESRNLATIFNASDCDREWSYSSYVSDTKAATCFDSSKEGIRKTYLVIAKTCTHCRS